MFQLISKHKPTGDQPQAIEKLTENLKKGIRDQVLLGVTGSGKTYTIAQVIKNIQRPTLVISHNKTLAAQLYQEFRDLFPQNSVHYFVSYYDYYQPEAYIPHTDTYIEKDAKINDEIDRLRHAATQALLTRDDVIIVASVSCIYNLGSPEEYKKLSLEIFEDQNINILEFIKNLFRLQYEKDVELTRGSFRNTKDEVEIFPATGESIIKVKFKKGRIEKILAAEDIKYGEMDETKPNFHRVLQTKIFPAKYWVADSNKSDIAISNIKAELEQHLKKLRRQGKFQEGQRLAHKTLHDLEMIKHTGYCHGIENYSRHLDFRSPGEAPFTLIDFFKTKKDFLTVIDESHITIPQIRGMFNGDRSRKETLIEYGFRLPSALDNRPLKFPEFQKRINQTIYVSATPGKYEMKKINSQGLVEQLVRPTGLLDPTIEVKPTQNQVRHLIKTIKERVEKNERILVTTLTKRMAEDLSEYLSEAGIKVNYLHSEIKTLDRLEIIKNLRTGTYDTIVGVNLLREGLDLPEVSLIAILDADKEGFLRNATTLIQTMGRAARNLNGHVIMYADKITESMRNAINETLRRRKIQEKYNQENNITPQTIIKVIKDYDLPISKTSSAKAELYYGTDKILDEDEIVNISEALERLNKLMQKAVKRLDFEEALMIRHQIQKIKEKHR